MREQTYIVNLCKMYEANELIPDNDRTVVVKSGKATYLGFYIKGKYMPVEDFFNDWMFIDNEWKDYSEPKDTMIDENDPAQYWVKPQWYAFEDQMNREQGTPIEVERWMECPK